MVSVFGVVLFDLVHDVETIFLLAASRASHVFQKRFLDAGSS